MKLTDDIATLMLILIFALTLLGCVQTTAPDGTVTKQVAPEAYLLARDLLKPTK